MGQPSFDERTAVPAAHELSVLRHELLNVLHGLTGMTGLLHRSGLTSEQLGWLEAIRQSVDQAAFLVRAAASWEYGGVAEKAPAEDFNGVLLLEQLLLAHTPAANTKGLDLSLSLASGLPERWQGDAFLLRQLLDNLLGNAVKFTAKGSIQLAARLEDDSTIVLAVSDTGPGVPAEERKRIFEARERGSLGKNKPGYGLGLWLSRQIVTRLGGEISCLPAAGGGAEFWVRLPRLARLAGGNYP